MYVQLYELHKVVVDSNTIDIPSPPCCLSQKIIFAALRQHHRMINKKARELYRLRQLIHSDALHSQSLIATLAVVERITGVAKVV